MLRLRSFVRVDLHVDALEAAVLEPDARQHRGHLGRDPLPDRVRAHPVADLERALAAARVQAAAAEQLATRRGSKTP